MSATPDVCLLGARLNAFRLGYVTGHVWIGTGGGGWLGAGSPAGAVVVESLAIQDRLGEAPNTCLGTIRGAKPIEGDTVTVALGSKGAAPVFAGRILRVTRVWGADNPAHVLYAFEATDPSWELGAVLISAQYAYMSASTIAYELVTRYAVPLGFHGVIDLGLPVLDRISFTNVTVLEACVQVARRIGGYAFCDYQKGIHLFVSADHVPAPRRLAPDHPSLAHVSYGRDLSQVVTRAIVEGGGGNALTGVGPGTSTLPVDPIGWYSAGGGLVRSGPQRLAYTGIVVGGAGAFAGTGVGPTTGPTLTVGVGTSAVELGAHGYAYTWVTATGETLPGPVTTVSIGDGVPAPAPMLGLAARPNVSSGLVIGTTYLYASAWSYVDSDTDTSQRSRQSALGSAVCQAWTLVSGIAGPTTAPAAVGAAGGSVDAGDHGYAYTFTTATGETAGSPAATGRAGAIAAPAAAPGFVRYETGSGAAQDPSVGFVPGAIAEYAALYSPTTAAPLAGMPISALGPLTAGIVVQEIGAGTGTCQAVRLLCPARTGDPNAKYGHLYMRLSGGPWYYAQTDRGAYLNGSVDDRVVYRPVAAWPLPAVTGIGSFTVSGIAAGPAGTTARKVYRTSAGGTDYRLVATVADNTSTTVTDTLADAARGAALMPSVDGTSVPGGITFGNYGGAWDPLAKRLLVYRLNQLQTAWYLVAVLPVGHAFSGAYWDGMAEGTLAAQPQYGAQGGTIAVNRVTVAGLAPGPGTVTARKVYRTAAGGGALKLLATLADNTSTALGSYDNTADAALGAAPPAVDTAGIVQSSRIVPAGSTTLTVTSTAPFAAGGGYVLAGPQVIRYTGLTATDLTGIPATGDGAIQSSIAYGTPVIVAPALTGIAATGAGAVVYPILRGDPVNVVAVVDDAAAQSALAALLGGGASGVREALLSDGRIGLTEAAARGAALLAKARTVVETVTYRSRDPQTRSGALVAVDLPAPTDVHGSFRVQDVQITRFHGPGLVPPVYETRASSDRFTFEDWVRQLSHTQAPPSTGETR